MNLCTTNPEWDAEDAANLAFAISSAKRALGRSLQQRGYLTDITVLHTDRPHPEYAGELAATRLDLTQRQLADWRVWDIETWTNRYIRDITMAALTSAAAD